MRSWPGSQIYSETFICSRYGSKCFKSQLKETKRPCRFIVVSMLVSFVPIICILGTWDITCLGVCGTQRESVLKALKIHRVRCHPAWNSGYSSSPLVVGLVFCGAHPHPRVVCWSSCGLLRIATMFHFAMTIRIRHKSNFASGKSGQVVGDIPTVLGWINFWLELDFASWHGGSSASTKTSDGPLQHHSVYCIPVPIPFPHIHPDPYKPRPCTKYDRTNGSVNGQRIKQKHS